MRGEVSSEAATTHMVGARVRLVVTGGEVEGWEGKQRASLSKRRVRKRKQKPSTGQVTQLPRAAWGRGRLSPSARGRPSSLEPRPSDGLRVGWTTVDRARTEADCRTRSRGQTEAGRRRAKRPGRGDLCTSCR